MNRIVSVLMLAALFFAAQEALAQSGSQPVGQKRKLDAPAFRTSKLSKAVDIPDIPTYPKAHKFVGGDSCPMTSGVSYTQCFSVIEEKQVVLDWYAQALQASGWQRIQTSSHNVSAKKQGSSCNITTASDFVGKGRTLVTISYFSESQR